MLEGRTRAQDAKEGRLRDGRIPVLQVHYLFHVSTSTTVHLCILCSYILVKYTICFMLVRVLLYICVAFMFTSATCATVRDYSEPVVLLYVRSSFCGSHGAQATQRGYNWTSPVRLASPFIDPVIPRVSVKYLLGLLGL